MIPERIGGTYSYVYELGRGLVARGHDVDVIASTQKRDAGPPYDLEGMTIHTYAFKKINPIYSTLQHLRRTAGIFETLAKERPVDVLSVHDAQLGLRAARSPLGRSVCQIPTFHAPGFLEFRLNNKWRIESEPSPTRRAGLHLAGRALEYWQRRFEEGVLKLADGVVVLSRYSKGHIERCFPAVNLAKVRVIPGGVDTERFAPAPDREATRRELGFDAATYLLTVRNLMPRMGLENLVDAMAAIAATRDDVRLVVCGGGPLRDSLEARIQEHGLAGTVTLAGRVSDEDLVRYYQASDAFVLPTEAMEGFGISTVEALSTNLPVIGTPAGATPEILGAIDPRLLTSDTTSEAIARCVDAWLEWRSEDAATSRYRNDVLGNYAWPLIVETIESYYEDVLSTFVPLA